MDKKSASAVEALIVAVPETAGSALYGMIDVLASTGQIWQQLVGREPSSHVIKPRIVSTSVEPFVCGNRIPIHPDVGLQSDPTADIVILPEMWLAPDDDMRGRYPELLDWIRRCYTSGSSIYSACSGSILLAASGLLAGREATSHWGYEDLFRTRYPEVHFRAEPNLAFADPAGRIVTAGGTTSWHDLAIHIISRHCSTGEALRIAKVYLLKWHSEGQLPYASLIRRQSHADSVVRSCEDWLEDHYCETGVLASVVGRAKIPERSLKRRFKTATGSTLIQYIQNLRLEDALLLQGEGSGCTGSTLIQYIQNLRLEEAKRLLETETFSIEDVSNRIGYENLAFFRRLFRRSTGLTPGQYRRMFRPVADANRMPAHADKSKGMRPSGHQSISKRYSTTTASRT